ncbi:MAG TPA: type II toxin-antitoxin system VapC family toxin [Vicinamibacterales bacterium]|nr:type II toxin-antitoxin system VapC family toxin [Vicinamibacterales bacterium]
MRAVDTNVLVRLIVRDDERQAAAEAFVAPGAWVPHVALVECAWVLHAVYDRTSSEIANAIERLLDHRELTLQDPDTVAAAVDAFRRRPAVGFSDCLLLEIARKAGHLPLGTFDRDLGRLDGAQRL